MLKLNVAYFFKFMEEKSPNYPRIRPIYTEYILLLVYPGIKFKHNSSRLTRVDAFRENFETNCQYPII